TPGVDVLELRVDLLRECTPAFVREQVAELRRITPLPLLYTVRSASQGGRLPDESEDLYFELVYLGLR
ncbi:type I 3-dehydroquinate dehydratase, partial [Staphylococcus aureus]|nr:type I 3-dehydroquinate dehydratase [Staphylococcus aureus]